MFDEAAKIAASVRAKLVSSIIMQDEFSDSRKRHAYILNAWAAGIDTTHFSLISVPRIDPKTLHIAQAVLDTAHQRDWKEFVLVTVDLHTARSRKAYVLAAKPYGISVSVAGIPVDGVSSSNWTATSSGLAMAFSETIKKIYYDIVVF